MKIKTILMPIRGDGEGNNVLAHAALLAKRYGAHVKALHCRPRPEDLLPYGVPILGYMRKQIVESGSKLADEQEQALRGDFARLIGEHGLSALDEEGPGPSASFQEVTGKQIEAIKVHGRLVDLIAAPKPDRDRNLGANTLKSALFASGRPVLMCPPRETAPTQLGEHVAIAWNGSTEAARAVALAMGVIEGAGRVTVLVGGEAKSGASGEDLLRYLAHRGVEATLNQFAFQGLAGRHLLRHVEEAGADMLIMGAYHDSHERETLLGGNTQIVVDEARTPVLMVH